MSDSVEDQPRVQDEPASDRASDGASDHTSNRTSDGASDRAQARRNYRIHLDVFEGPLDLLLHLVKKHELDIFDIPIAFIANEYLKYIELMRSLNLDVATEFLLMAATLAHIKSRSMLPVNEQEEAGEEDLIDTKEKLSRKLLEYKRFREAAHRLGTRPILGNDVWERPGGPLGGEPGERPLAEIGVFKLLEAFAQVMKKAKVDMSHDVVVDRVSVTARVNELMDMLRSGDQVRFTDCIKNVLAGAKPGQQVARSELVVTLLAILEMARLKLIKVYQSSDDHEIYLTPTDFTADIGPLDLDESTD